MPELKLDDVRKIPELKDFADSIRFEQALTG